MQQSEFLWGRIVTKLSDIFGRKAGEHSEKVIPIPGLLVKGRDADERFAGGPSIGVLAEEHETLRNLLSEAGRRIDEINELKDVYDRLAAPFNGALKNLEHEKALAMSLARRLEEQSRVFDALEREFYAVDKRAKLSEAEVERLHIELEVARENGRSLDGERQQLTAEIKALRAEAEERKRQLDDEIAAHRAASEKQASLHDQLDTADRRVLEFEAELAGARERLSLLESDKRSLQSTLEDAQSENARLARRASETEALMSVMRGQLGRLELTQAEATAERARLASALEEAREQHQAERQGFVARIDGLQSRATAAEGLLAEARQGLIARAEETRNFDRKAMEASVARSSAERRVAQLEAQQDSNGRKIRELENTNSSLKEEHAVASKALRSRELALTRAEEKIAELGERNAQLEANLQVGRSGIDARAADLQSSLERERAERAAMEGALAEARRENERLHRRITELRSGALPAGYAKHTADPDESIFVPDVLNAELKRSGG